MKNDNAQDISLSPGKKSAEGGRSGTLSPPKASGPSRKISFAGLNKKHTRRGETSKNLSPTSDAFSGSMSPISEMAKN
jgi:hypothetical protein